MRDYFVVSDTHFGDKNIIRYHNRPFSSVEEMNEALVQNWNSVVKPNDYVYHLGDVYMKSEGFSAFSADVLLGRLNGKKRLIVGNHDDLKDPVLHRHFKKMMLWRHWSEYELILTHVPVHVDHRVKDALNVHGHIHSNRSPDGPYKNVSVEVVNYTPVNIEELRKR